ncbi:2-dehydropantoate 2-reductase [Synchytrium microbalum]|uniref:2-dehydropantoate 2-reductase n=1 Tax=Synchytrium microbalum TaxID=1806994 RepID=A0A507C759_9FUNG|nr:2-dehydropantoate 2-reductase [Synchytrium microbalum]TPX37410.1 2-dehydropantoate 2-reductase [Synchytrium microbalum]
MATTEILVVGAGAVGALYGSRLHASPMARVSCICRSNYEIVKRQGFTIKSPYYGEYSFKPTGVYKSVQEAADAKTFDFVLVSTKSLPDFENMADIIAPAMKVSTKTAIVLLQNGVGVEQPYRVAFPKNPIISAVEYVSAAQDNGVVQHNKWTRICLGNYSGVRPEDADEERNARGVTMTKKLVEIFLAGGVRDAEFWEEIALVRWHKVALNAAMNASAVLTGGLTNAEMSKDPIVRAHLKDVMEEIMTAAPQIIGKPFPKQLASAEAILKSTERNEAKTEMAAVSFGESLLIDFLSRNSGSKPSMLLDFEAGRALEIETILGEPCRIARAHNLRLYKTEAIIQDLLITGVLPWQHSSNGEVRVLLLGVVVQSRRGFASSLRQELRNKKAELSTMARLVARTAQSLTNLDTTRERQLSETRQPSVSSELSNSQFSYENLKNTALANSVSLGSLTQGDELVKSAGSLTGALRRKNSNSPSDDTGLMRFNRAIGARMAHTLDAAARKKNGSAEFTPMFGYHLQDAGSMSSSFSVESFGGHTRADSQTKSARPETIDASYAEAMLDGRPMAPSNPASPLSPDISPRTSITRRTTSGARGIARLQGIYMARGPYGGGGGDFHIGSFTNLTSRKTSSKNLDDDLPPVKENNKASKFEDLLSSGETAKLSLTPAEMKSIEERKKSPIRFIPKEATVAREPISDSASPADDFDASPKKKQESLWDFLKNSDPAELSGKPAPKPSPLSPNATLSKDGVIKSPNSTSPKDGITKSPSNTTIPQSLKSPKPRPLLSARSFEARSATSSSPALNEDDDDDDDLLPKKNKKELARNQSLAELLNSEPPKGWNEKPEKVVVVAEKPTRSGLRLFPSRNKVDSNSSLNKTSPNSPVKSIPLQLPPYSDPYNPNRHDSLATIASTAVRSATFDSQSSQMSRTESGWSGSENQSTRDSVSSRNPAETIRASVGSRLTESKSISHMPMTSRQSESMDFVKTNSQLSLVDNPIVSKESVDTNRRSGSIIESPVVDTTPQPPPRVSSAARQSVAARASTASMGQSRQASEFSTGPGSPTIGKRRPSYESYAEQKFLSLTTGPTLATTPTIPTPSVVHERPTLNTAFAVETQTLDGVLKKLVEADSDFAEVLFPSPTRPASEYTSNSASPGSMNIPFLKASAGPRSSVSSALGRSGAVTRNRRSNTNNGPPSPLLEATFQAVIAEAAAVASRRPVSKLNTNRSSSAAEFIVPDETGSVSSGTSNKSATQYDGFMDIHEAGYLRYMIGWTSSESSSHHHHRHHHNHDSASSNTSSPIRRHRHESNASASPMSFEDASGIETRVDSNSHKREVNREAANEARFEKFARLTLSKLNQLQEEKRVLEEQLVQYSHVTSESSS